MSDEKVDMNLDALVSKLQTEGVDRAKAEGDAILEKAKDEAAAIKSKAEAAAEDMLRNAETEAEQFRKNAVASIELAGRDMIISLQQQIRELFDRSLKSQIGNALESDDLLKEMISTLVNEWIKDKKVELHANEKQREQLLKIVEGSVQDELAKGLEIKSNNNMSRGFRIFMKDDEVNYDFTEETVTEALKANLNPSTSKLLGEK